MATPANGNDSDWAEAVEAQRRLRAEIDAVDLCILAALNQRAQLVQAIGEVKQRIQTDVYVPQRERDIIERLQAENPGPLPSESIVPVFREIISATRALEKRLRIAYLGPEGSFHHQACLLRFGQSAEGVPVRSMRDIFAAVERSTCDYGVVAIENSTEGVVGEARDLFVDSALQICAELSLPIEHALLSRGALADLRTVYAHAQALAQCRHWLAQNLPQAEPKAVESNTRGAELAAQDPAAAAIAGSLVADRYGLSVLAVPVNDYVGNTTRFLVIGCQKNPPSGKDKTSVILFIQDRPGALYDALEPFKREGINLTSIESRPIKREVWQYLFHLDFYGHQDDPPVQRVLAHLAARCLSAKVLGSYPREVEAR